VNDWNKSTFNEYIDKRRLISEAEYFSKAVERAYETLPFLRIPEIARIEYPQYRINLTGNDLDQRIRDVDALLDEAIRKVLLGQSDPVPAPSRAPHWFSRM
jgi:hypothetical protein